MKYRPWILQQVRKRGHPTDRVEDLTQGFFAEMLADESLTRATTPERGRLRTFLQRHLTEQHRRANALKRGGGQAVISPD